MGDIPCRYCVILKKGSYDDEFYFWTTREKVLAVFNRFNSSEENEIYLGHITGSGKDRFADRVNYSKQDFGSLVFRCRDKESANKCIEFFGLDGRIR